MLASRNINHYSNPADRAKTLCGKPWSQNYSEMPANPVCPECAKSGRQILKETINRYSIRTE